MKRRSISNSDIEAWLECHLQYLFRRRGVRKTQPPEVQHIVGDATHEVAAVEDPQERVNIVARQLERLPVEKREEAARLITKHVAVADQLDEAEEETVVEREKEKLERWTDPVTGWDFVMKSDKIGYIRDERGREVMQISDRKTSVHPRYKRNWRTAKRQTEKVRRQLFFFALVASLARGYLWAIKLVAEFTGEPEPGAEVNRHYEDDNPGVASSEHTLTFWSAPRMREKALVQLRTVIGEIEQAYQTKTFEPNTGFHCNTCDYRDRCEAFKLWSKQQGEEGEGGDNTPPAKSA